MLPGRCLPPGDTAGLPVTPSGLEGTDGDIDGPEGCEGDTFGCEGAPDGREGVLFADGTTTGPRPPNTGCDGGATAGIDNAGPK